MKITDLTDWDYAAAYVAILNDVFDEHAELIAAEKCLNLNDVKQWMADLETKIPNIKDATNRIVASENEARESRGYGLITSTDLDIDYVAGIQHETYRCGMEDLALWLDCEMWMVRTARNEILEKAINKSKGFEKIGIAIGKVLLKRIRPPLPLELQQFIDYVEKITKK